MFKRAAILTWILGLILAELLGIGIAYIAHKYGVSEAFIVSMTDAVIIFARFLSLIYIANKINIGLANAIYRPLPRNNLSFFPFLVLATILT